MKHRFITYILFFFLISGVAYADDKLAFRYNIVPESADNSAIDKKKNKLSFKIFENQGKLFFKGQEIIVTDNKFEINIEELSGKQVFTISNEINEEVTFTYYISDSNGLVKDFKLKEINDDIYIATFNEVPIFYSSKDKKNISKLITLLEKVPTEVICNLKEIALFPYAHSSKASGVTQYDKITFYNLFSHSDSQIKNIVFHEIAHTWAYYLMQQKKLDYSYSEFSQAVTSDKNYVSNYSKKFDAVGHFSEDFAESIAFYLINKENFSKKFPARTKYIKTLLNVG